MLLFADSAISPATGPLDIRAVNVVVGALPVTIQFFTVLLVAPLEAPLLASHTMVLVKSSPQASYKQVVDVLDEMTINQVKKYAVIKPELTELEWISALNE